MVSAKVFLTLAASAAFHRIATAAAIPTDDEAFNSTNLLGSRTVDDESSLDKRGGPPPAPTIYSQYQVDHLDTTIGPLPKGVSGIPDGVRDGSGATVCLCNDENYHDCMCIKDMQLQGWNTCFSNRGSDGQWSGFSNDKVSSLTISGDKRYLSACKFYESGDCEGQPFLVGSAATSYFLQPQLGAGQNDILSSIFCGVPETICISGTC